MEFLIIMVIASIWNMVTCDKITDDDDVNSVFSPSLVIDADKWHNTLLPLSLTCANKMHTTSWCSTHCYYYVHVWQHIRIVSVLHKVASFQRWEGENELIQTGHGELAEGNKLHC